MLDLKSMTIPELEQFLAENGEPKFRAKQIFSWIHKGVNSLEEMTNLSKETKTKLGKVSYISKLIVLQKQISSDGTQKFLFETGDQNAVESVFMKYKHGNSLCISSQVGCRMGCSFCASTVNGLVRNLTAGEILDQILTAQRETLERVDSVVMMGIGEPLDNFEQVLKFLALVNDTNGIHLGMRHISISTCGLVPCIYDLADRNLQLTLSISLHAPTDAMRSSMMQVNNKYGVLEVVQAGKDYAKKTMRKVYYEYTLIEGLNDGREQATALGKLLSGSLCHVNLIALNPVEGKSYRPPQLATIFSFSKELSRYGVTSTLRRKLGEDIDAACGQLRAKHS